MKKRFPALTLLLSLLLCVTVRAAGPRLEVHLPEVPVAAGEDFTVTVDLTGNPGILNIQFTLAFDKDKMTCTDVDMGALLADAMSVANPEASTGAIVAAISITPLQGDQTVGIFHFTAKETLSDFHVSIERITMTDANRKSLDVDVQIVEPSGAGDSGNDSGSSESDTKSDAGSTSGSGANGGNAGSTSGSGANGANAGNTSGSGANGGNAGNTSGSGANGNNAGSTSGSGANGGSTSGSGANGANGGSTSGSGANGNNAGSTSGSGANTSGAGSTGGTESDSGETSEDKPIETAPVPPRFSDTAGIWAEAYINTAAERGLFQGYSDGTFRPANQLTRAQFMMVLWNLAGRPAPSGDAPFTDMRGQIENFQNAVAWAYEKGYVNGTSPTTFSPGEPLTRQAAVKILFAYNGQRRGPEALLTEVYNQTFTDSGRISAWARDAMYWAVYQTILSGTSPTTLDPGGTVTRAQLAAIMVRYTDRFPA